MRVLLVPSIRRGGGLGHLVRMMRLALSWQGEAALYLETDKPEHWTEEEVRSFFPSFPWDSCIAREPDSLPWDWVVFDRKATSLEEYRRLHRGLPTLGLDEGGEARSRMSYLLDTFPVVNPVVGPNRYVPAMAPLWEGKNGLSSSASPEIQAEGTRQDAFLLSFGGEDPHRLTEVAYEALRAVGIRSQDIHVLLGPARKEPFTKPCGNILIGEWESRRYFHRYRWVVTSFGLTPYEALQEGALPILLNPSTYHEKLSRAAGFFSLGVRRVSAGRLRAALQEPAKILPPWHGPTSIKEVSLAALLSTLKVDIGTSCPLCGQQENPSTFRFPERTFFHCSCCGVEYRMDFSGKRMSYTEGYFFEEYRKQYGKTYLEDFDAIKAQGKRRLTILQRAQSATGGKNPSLCLEGKTVLDVGCAYGPFLQAAREMGMTPYGVDVSEEAVRYVADQLGIPAVVSDIESFDPVVAFGVARFDVVSLWYVIEHLERVGETLRKIGGLVEKGGWLLFSTPNGRGITSLRNPLKFRKENPLDHVTIWNPRMVKEALTPLGFSVYSIQTPTRHPERFPAWIRRVAGKKGCGALEQFFHIGDTFEVYAKKIDHDSRGWASPVARH